MLDAISSERLDGLPRNPRGAVPPGECQLIYVNDNPDFFGSGFYGEAIPVPDDCGAPI